MAVGLTLLGILIAFGPWVTRLARDLGAERRERIRQEERAELAAHLHDSVLQTLALIQRTDDPARMSILARHQEGELREWLYGNAPVDGSDLVSTALKGAATRIESDHQVPIDVVTVGDHPVDEPSRALVSAASEALVNAAKHSGSDRLSLFFEAEEDQLSVFVTDQGKGFDRTRCRRTAKGSPSRSGARVERAGGTVEINSEPGEGTEVDPSDAGAGQMSIRLYLVDDHRLFLAGVKAELEEEFEIVGSANDVDTAIEQIRGLKPAVVLIDVHMPDGGGIAVVEGVGRDRSRREVPRAVGVGPGRGRDRDDPGRGQGVCDQDHRARRAG